MEGKISVIVPIYNQERYLNKSISSIINQKYTNLEIILINDGSTDSSIEIIDDFALKDSRIRVFSKPNGGLVDATIYGINQATGEYIAFLDPDDYIGPLYLWDLLSQMDDDIDFVASGFYRNNNGQFIPVILSEDSKIVGDQFQKLRDHYLLDGKIDFSDKIFISRWNKLYRANVVKTVAAPFFNYREVTLGEDSIFTYLMLSHSRGCKTIKGPKDYFYNVGNQNSMMVSNTIERHMEKSKLAYNSLKNLLINEGLSTKQAYALYFFEVESVFERLMKTDFEQFRKLYYHLRKDEVYTTSLKLFRDLSYSAKTWIRIFGRLYFPAFLYSYIRLKLKSDLRTIKLFLGNTRFILKYLVKNGLVKTHYQIKFRRRRDNNFKEINKFLPIIDSRVKEIITSYTGGKTELNECPVCNNIFLFWWDGFDTAPELVKACTETVYKYYPDCAIHLIDKNNYRLGIKLYIYKNHEYQILTIPNNVNKKTMNYITTFLNEKFLSYNDTSKQISIINGNKDLTNLLEYVSDKDADALTNYLKKHYNDEYKGEYIELIYGTNDNYITPFKYTIKDIESFEKFLNTYKDLCYNDGKCQKE
jgi:glycosyltransferase involved in cell wall biosynthesis